MGGYICIYLDSILSFKCLIKSDTLISSVLCLSRLTFGWNESRNVSRITIGRNESE